MEQKSEVKISRRSALKQLSFFTCAVPVSLMVMAGSSKAAGKASKTKAEYQDSPMGGMKCSDCVHFLPPKSCAGVEGDISPSGWCKFFKAKA